MRFFVAEFVREQILAHTRQEVPHGVAVVVERFDESGGRAAHRARHPRRARGAQGDPRRRAGEHDEGDRDRGARARRADARRARCTCKLWVRATPDWMNDPAQAARARVRRRSQERPMTKHHPAARAPRSSPGARAARPSSPSSGGPNVGKSTLFNRLARARIAIVHDEPGVTRDRKYADTSAFGRAVHPRRHRRLRPRGRRPDEGGDRAATCARPSPRPTRSSS